MRTIDTITIDAPLERVFDAARQVERWPEILSHYRWVRMLGGGRVEMAAWRPFGRGGRGGPSLARWPTWWVSEMTVDATHHVIQYRHVQGITTGMNVRWVLRETGRSVAIDLVHEWDGPPWPLIGGLAATLVIGPVFVHGIASRTLAGLKRHAEA